MTGHDLRAWQHAHDFSTPAQHHAERRTRWVVGLTFVAMLVELTAGWLTGSMALLADAWHMASHVGALGLSAFAYAYARRHAGNERFTFGTGKVNALAGYTSALLLGMVAAWMIVESVHRLLDPVPVRYAEAMAVAVFGLAVNLLSAWLLGDDHAHGHDAHDHRGDHAHPTHDDDHNLKAAYLHVIADALTSVLAIVALAGGMFFGWSFLDPMMGLVGAALVGRWAWGLARDSGAVLVDAEDHDEIAANVRRIIEAEPDHEIADLHVWRIGPGSRACIVSILTHTPHTDEYYRERLAAIDAIKHLTIEVKQCRAPACAPPPSMLT